MTSGGIPASQRVKGLLFDVDGTLLLSDRALGGYDPLPGAVDLLVALTDRGVPFGLLTNGSAYPPAEQAAKLRRLGFPVSDEQMMTPSSVAADHFVRRGYTSVLVLGNRGVGHALAAAGLRTLYAVDKDAERADAVYVGWHPDFSMKDIEAASHAIWSGAGFYTASDVPFFATKSGRTLGYSYAIVGAIGRMTKVRAKVLGKPSLGALRFVAKRLGIAPNTLGVVGDDPAVEGIMARRGGATMLAVTTGTTSAQEWRNCGEDRRAHRILDGLHQVLEHCADVTDRLGPGVHCD
jgi:4-nitrophenyl phosphatase